jgi:hypothetical protein
LRRRITLMAASRPDCCNDYASRDDARTRRKRLRPWSSAPATGLVPDQDGRHFQVLVEPKINVIAGMAPMIGI